MLRTLTLLFLLASTHALGAADDEKIPAPPFALPAIANAEGSLDLASLRGSVVYLDFWASWCGPCRLSLPALNTMWHEVDREDFKVIAVSIDVVEEDSLDFLERYPVDYPVLIDTVGETPQVYAVNGMPSGYLIDREGYVREVHVGFSKGDEIELRKNVDALLAE